ncbi:LysR family transcriptional regulator [Saccharibacillus endophyticus]|uniref:LysR family transcriptional regulator n=1 Tax=Saccharibacillus endophyticus TaxID=2060666 RepID=A0ABQ1ZP77_9BACL|nr:LysR family transcriptional regulator [Saccharibacillus endophyticus]GGH72819.1 LysR family transcriptional regulator [Saccharibacillus endophyticus]
MQVNLEFYKVFLKAAETGNLTQAAVELHMTQPSVSYAIGQLEKSTNLVLFQRLSKGVRLTSEGQLLYESLSKAFQYLELAEQQIQSLNDHKIGSIRIGSTGGIIKNMLMPGLDEFRRQYPGIRIKLLQAKTSEILTQIEQNKLDIGFVYLPIKAPNLIMTPLKSMENGFVVGEKFKSLSEMPLTIEQLLGIPLLLLSAGSTTRIFLERWFSDYGHPISADIELNSIDLLVDFAKRGYGAAFVSTSFVEKELERGELFVLHTRDRIPAQELGMITRKNTTPLIRSFTETLSALFKSP